MRSVEAAAATSRALPSEKAERIVEAMRTSVARRGVAGSTFDHVAREAGVSRGLLHYYFGTKERLLAEVLRRDCEVRMASLDARMEGADTLDDVLERMLAELHELVSRDPDILTLVFELFTVGRRNPDLAAEFAQLTSRTRDQLTEVLAAKRDEGVLHLAAEPEAIADLLFSLADGLALRMVAEPDRDWTPAVAAATQAIRPLLDAR
jgi:AcrR family transcriptional regulator